MIMSLVRFDSILTSIVDSFRYEPDAEELQENFRSNNGSFVLNFVHTVLNFL